MDRTEAITQIRYFNRTYLPAMHLLDANYLGTGHTVTDARVLFEVRDAPRCTARHICERMNIDKGYLSRILSRFEAEGLVVREPSPADGRSKLVDLTAEGEAYVRELARGGARLVSDALAGLDDGQVDELSRHMRAILAILGR